jgi:hypothetical protein
MFMFLPFLLALITAMSVAFGKHAVSIALFLVTLLVVLASFKHHATDALNLMF